jgi:hypothetical protein
MANTTRTRQAPEAPKTPPPAPPETAPQPVAAAKRANGRHIYGTGPAAPKTTGPPADVDFWDWLSEFTNDQWQHLIAYLWRYAPITDRRANGKPTSIRKYGVRFDLERIMLDEGSGGYRVDLVQIDPASGAQKRIAQHYFSIMNMSYPPRIPLGEWTDDPENEMYKWAEPALRARDAEAEQGNEAGAPPPGYMDPNAMFNTVLNGMRTLRGEHSDNSALASQILQMVQSNQAQMMALNDPVKQLETLRTLLATLTPPANASESMLVTILRDELKATREEMKELRNKPQSPGILEELIEKAPRLKELGNLLGLNRRGNGGDGTNWGEVAIQVVDKLSNAIPYAFDMFKNRQNTPPGQAGFELAPRPQYQPPVQQAPPAAPQDADATQRPPAPAAASTEEEETRRRLQGHLNKYQQLITAVAPFLIDQYKSGLTGYDFRDWFISRHGILNWTGLRDEVGAGDLTALAQLHPHLKVALAPPEKLFAFLTEVFTEPGQEPEPGQESNPGEEAEAARPVITMPAGRA